MKKFFITLSVIFLASFLYAKVFVFLPWGELEFKPARSKPFNIEKPTRSKEVTKGKKVENTNREIQHSVPTPALIDKISQYIQSGNWHLLKNYLSNDEYEKFIKNFTLAEKVSKTKSSAANIPYLFNERSGNEIIVKKIGRSEKKRISFELEGDKAIKSFTVSNISDNSLVARLAAGSDYTYVKLPEMNY